ncbi:unnamed protein product [Microthlaspi erraticum]|uniref:Uncharacterized protein n=1 Tax=Microthlaspi erraticum TaxID=1685480 RepID=A0A6D2K977_9BRAS|nr:unnamed protein product [Microthlaspi erraticum]
MGQKPGARDLNAVVDWQQQSGYLYASGEVSTVTLWDLEKEQLVRSIPSESECGVTALSASQVHGGQLAAGFADGSLRLYDVRSPEPLVCATRPHQKVEKVVGLSFQPGLDPAKVVSASQAGDIQFLDLRTTRDTYLTIDAHRGSLTALAVHRHAHFSCLAGRSVRDMSTNIVLPSSLFREHERNKLNIKRRKT